MSVNLEQTDGKEGIDGEVMGPLPQPAKPKDDNCATAVAVPSFSSSRRVKFPIACVLDALSEAKVGPHGKSVSFQSLPFLASVALAALEGSRLNNFAFWHGLEARLGQMLTRRPAATTTPAPTVAAVPVDKQVEPAQ